MDNDQQVISFEDHLLRQADVHLLENGNWINDNIIGFMFEFFTHIKFHEKAEIVSFVDPDIVQLVKLCSEDDASQILSPLHLNTKQLIFLPLNDNDSEVEAGGSHWSLMVFDTSSSDVEHYDSCPGFHVDTAAVVFRIFSKVIYKNRGYDCGIYVIKITEEVCSAKIRGTYFDATELTSDSITEYRREIKNLILELAQNVDTE